MGFLMTTERAGIMHGFLLFDQICIMSTTWHGHKLEKQIHIQIGLMLDDCVMHEAEHFLLQTSNNLNNSLQYLKTV